MRVLVVGGGAREHALGWKLLRDDPTLELICEPGNPGLAELGRCVQITPKNPATLAALARREEVAFTVVGPEGPLEAGIVDHFRENGLAIFGPSNDVIRAYEADLQQQDAAVSAGASANGGGAAQPDNQRREASATT